MLGGIGYVVIQWLGDRRYPVRVHVAPLRPLGYWMGRKSRVIKNRRLPNCSKQRGCLGVVRPRLRARKRVQVVHAEVYVGHLGTILLGILQQIMTTRATKYVEDLFVLTRGFHLPRCIEDRPVVLPERRMMTTGVGQFVQ